MPLSPEEFYAHALAGADEERRMPLSRLTAWEIFPFESDGLRVAPLAAPNIPEPPRHGEAGVACRSCDDTRVGAIWDDDHWRLDVFDEPSGAPLVAMLTTREHYDMADLPEELAAELGRLIVHTVRAIESLPHVARAHVSRWGDGGEHVHLFFFARPAGFVQLRGTCFAIWDDLLPPVDRVERDADATEVARALAASYGGRVRV